MTQSPSDRPRLLILAHSCNPEFGSEPGLGWNWVVQAAKRFPTWVICDEQYNRAAIERFIARNGPIANLKFEYVAGSRSETFLCRVPGAFYAAYNLWHRRAFRIAKELHGHLHFDLVHQLNLMGFREPGYLWKLDSPFMWGPVGGAQNYPWQFLSSAGWVGAAKEMIRNLLNNWQLWTARRVGLAARKAEVVLAATNVNARAIATRRQAPVTVLLDTGVHLLREAPRRNFEHGGPLRIIWSGVFEHRKALHLLLQALSALPERAKYELQILGRGPLERRWRRLARRLNVEQHCRWLGWLDHDEALDRFRWADVFAFTSLRDTSGTVVLESLAAGTPMVCFDHQGTAETVTEECGIKLPVTKPREAIRLLSEALLRLHDHREELIQLSHGALQRAEYYDWDRQGARMATIYRDVLGIQESRTLNSGIKPCSNGHYSEVVAAGSYQGGE
ncbi:MAG TPA: glycosyltransferase [Pirellulales bacterium]